MNRVAMCKKNKSSKHPNHKHIYEPCLLKLSFDTHVTEYEYYLLGKRCVRCGKLAIAGAFPPVVELHLSGRKIVRLMTNEEILEKYHDLPIVECNTKDI